METINFNCEEKLQELMEMLKEKDNVISQLKEEMKRKEIQCHRLAREGSDF
jgi:hypothetical protein